MKKLLIAATAMVVLVSCSVKAPEGTALFDYFTYEGNDDFYAQNPLPGDDYVYNPILAGWYSDPAICSNGQGDYFIVTSTFVYFPGVPIFHSRDLVNWEQIGNILDRPSQLPNLDGQRISGGIYAPDLKYNPHNKTYYMITTDVAGGNFYVKTQDPWGDWSDPVYLPEVKGIDPSLFFDVDGKAYVVNCDGAPGKSEYNGHRSIRCIELDLENDCTVGERKVLVDKGSRPENNPYWCEGPHLYNIDGIYYLMCAEGGTNPNEHHSEVIFRSDNPWGPFESYEGNPILTQVGLDPQRANPVTCAGHADLVQAPDGGWWAVFLADRPFRDDYENIGRETHMLPVTWTEDKWPVILESGKEIPLIVRHEGVKRSGNVTFGNFNFTDDFSAPELGLSWMTLRTPALDKYSFTAEPGFLQLFCTENLASQPHTPSAILHRLSHHKFSAETRVYFTPSSETDCAGLLMFKDERHQYFLNVSAEGVKLHKVEAVMVAGEGRRLTIDDASCDLATAPLKNYRFVDLKVVSDAETFAFYYAVNGKNWKLLIDGVDATYLTSVEAGGFTGTVVGPYACKF